VSDREATEQLDAAKRQLRRAISERSKQLTPQIAEAAGLAVARLLLADAGIRATARVALYASLPYELPTRALFEGLVEIGVVRLLPRIRDDRIEFAAVENWVELEAGAFDVLEPPDHLPSVSLTARDVVIVPGRAFDESGNRLGHGKAYYDRAFSGDRSESPRLIGAAFEIQIVPRVPHDSHDRSMDAIVTEKGLREAVREA
jgi:5-formyltetrahydrofolate cyclo-ligase